MPSIEKRKAAISSNSLPVWERKKRKYWNSSLNICNDQIREKEEQRCSESSSMSSSSSNVLPHDIIINEILLRISAKYLFRFRLVSKYWFHCITDPKFVKMHFNFQAMNKPPLLMMYLSFLRPLCQVHLDDIDKNGGDLLQQLQQQQQQHQQQEGKSPQFWGSSNGLMCLQITEAKKVNNPVCLWNPCTKEFKQLPYRPTIFPPDRSGSTTESFGFGYSNDYKVIRNVGYSRKLQFLHTLVEVYTLRTNSWKVIGKYLYEVALHHIGVSVGGGVYWLARRRSIDMIICYDIANEDYKEISCPPSVLIKTVEPRQCNRYMSSEYVKLTELKGFLCIINPIVEQKCMEVWAMNKEEEEEEEEEESNWSKLFTIREPINAFPYQILSSMVLLGSVKNNSDEILMMVDRRELLLYNPKNDKTRALIQIDDKTRALIQIDEANADIIKRVQTCMDSLVSLNSGTYDIL